MEDGNQCVNNLRLTFLKFKGQFFSWSKRGDSVDRIYSRIDHCLGNVEWINLFGGVYVQYLMLGISHHSPLFVTTKGRSKGGGRPFKFFNRLTDHEEFKEIISQELSK